MQLEDFVGRYPEVKGIGGWVDVSPSGTGARIDAYLTTVQLQM
jgi:hypothetical protein